ncbi:MAG: hypothetical protein RL885_02700 [Planctomycetota bacterium]
MPIDHASRNIGSWIRLVYSSNDVDQPAREVCISAHGGYTDHAGPRPGGRTTGIPVGARLQFYTLHGSKASRGNMKLIMMGRNIQYLTLMNGGQIYDYHLGAYQGDAAEIDRCLDEQAHGTPRDIICIRSRWWGRGVSLGSVLRQVHQVHRYSVYHFCACRYVAGPTQWGKREPQRPYIPVRR